MKILHLNYHENSGGAAIAANRIHRALLKQNIDSLMLGKIKLVIYKVIYTNNITERFLDKVNLYFQRKLNKLNSNFNNFKVSRSYNFLPTFKLKYIKQINPDIINLHWIGNNFINIKELSLIHKPIVWTLHDMWPYCGSEHYSLDERFENGYKNDLVLKKKGHLKFDLDKIVWLNKKKYLGNKLNFVATSSW